MPQKARKVHMRRWNLALAVGLLLTQGCTQITLLRVEELRQVQAHVDTLSMRLQASQARLAKGQKNQAELLRVIRADMQVRFSELSQRVSAIEGGVHESQARLTDIDRKTAEIRERWDEKARADSITQAMQRAEEENLYQIAYSDFVSGRHDLARAGFQDLLGRYPETSFADKASYWLAECSYAQKQLDSAKAGYTGYLKAYPEGKKVCAALYKLGLVYERAGKQKHRDALWDKLQAQCPDSEEARAAAGRQSGK